MRTEILTRAAQFEPSTFNQEKNTVEVVFSEGAEVTRWDMQGQFIERLDMAPAAVDLSRIKGGPVLADHDRWSVNAVLGIVEDASVDGKRGTATIRFGARPEVQGIVTDVRGGIIRAVSAGYTVQTWEESKRADGVRVKTAKRWSPVEISFTPLAADPAAKTRSLGETFMEPNQQIRELATAVGVQAAFADDLIQRNTSLEDARTAIIREAADRLPAINNRQPATVTRENSPDDLVRSAADALYVRFNPSHTPAEQARQFVGLRMADLARHFLAARGLGTLGGDAEVITRSLHSTSDFPNLLSNITNKYLAAQYQLAPSGMKTVCKRATVPDFKPRNILRRGEMPKLEKVNEHGEFKRGAVAENKEAYSIDTFGKVFGITRKALINDDLGAFGDVAASWGIQAVEFENGFLCDLLTSNSGGGPKLADTVNLFHASHGNLAASGGAISDTTLSAGRLALRTQKGLDGTTPVNFTAKYLVVPAALETTAERYLSLIYPAQAANVNPFGGTNRLELVVDPRLDAKSATRWYLFADPNVWPVIEYAYLQGFEGLQVETRAGFDVDGVEIKARLDFGAGGVDYRGGYSNPGA